MNIEEIIRAWKADEDDQSARSATSPIGEELTNQELQEALGGFVCLATCVAAGTARCLASCLASCLDGTVPVP